MKNLLYTIVFCLVVVMTTLAHKDALAEDLGSANFIVRNPTISAGGGLATSTSFETSDVIGQIITGTSTSANFEGETGFGYVHDTVFSITAPAAVNYGSNGVSIGSQVLNAGLNPINVTDIRGISSPWSLTMAVTNLTTRGGVLKVAGDNSTLSSTGTYTGVVAPDRSDKYVVEIQTGGTVGTATFKWTDPVGTVTQNVMTAASVLLSNGLSINFADAIYISGDKWVLPVDSIAYGNLQMLPAGPTVNYGDSNVVSGSDGTFSGSSATSNSRTIISSDPGGSQGSYTQNVELRQTVHANTLRGTFNGTIVLTLS
ncbi:MAG: hypothetical protein HY225_02185 [Candidatus Vogelbacteria bacterium]|nr:hypothetical protein [Candidatus Vogelbacteria bacterium]